MSKYPVIRGSVLQVGADSARVMIILGSDCRTPEGEPLPKIVTVRGNYHRSPVIDVTVRHSIAFGDLSMPRRYVKKGDIILLSRHLIHNDCAAAWCYEEEAQKARLPESPLVVATVSEPVTTVSGNGNGNGTVKRPKAVTRNGHVVSHPSKYRCRPSKQQAGNSLEGSFGAVMDEAVAATK